MPKKTETIKKVKKTPAIKKTAPKKAAVKKVVAKKAAPKMPASPKKEMPKVLTPTQPKDIKAQTELVKKYRGSAKDTGSIGVQIALLTDRINLLAKHLAKHLHDFDSKRGLLILVGKRRRLLNYLRKNDEKTYVKLVKDLKLKK